MLSVGKLSTR